MASLTLTPIMTFVQTLISSILASAAYSGTAVNLIWSDQSSSKPAQPYVSLRFASIKGIGMDELIYTGGDSPQTEVRGRHQTVLEIRWIGPGSMEGLHILEHSLAMPTNLLQMDENKVWVLGYRPVQNITWALDKTNWEERAVVEFLVNYCESVIDTQVGEIASMNMGVNDGNGNETFNIS